MKLSIVIPAYNKEKIIKKALTEVKKTVDSLDTPYEVIIIDDHSTDNTYNEIIQTISKWKNFKAFKKQQNGGKGSALKEGFKKTSGDLIAFMDADLDLPPSQLKVFIDLMNVYNADAVIGSKRNSLSQVNYSTTRGFLSWAYYKLVRGLFNLKVSDTQVGLKLFKRKPLEEVINHTTMTGFAFDLELLVLMKRKGFKIGEAPIIMKHSKLGSSVSVLSILKMLKDTVELYLKLNF